VNNKKKRILLVAEFSQLNTGFSVMNNDLLMKLHKTGKYELAEFASYVNDDDPRIHQMPWKVYPVQPSENNKKETEVYQKNYQTAQFGSERFEQVVLDFKPDIVFSYRDYWHDEFITRSPYRSLFHYVWSACIDSEPPREEWISTFSTVDTITSYTDWGLNVIRNYGRGLINCADFNTMPGVDLDVFKPMDKGECREKLGLESKAKIFLTVMRNQPRKLFPEIIRAFMNAIDELYKSGKKEEADNSYLYLHTSNTDVGFDLEKEVIKYQASNKVLFTYICDLCQHTFPSFNRGHLCHCPSCGKFNAHTANTSVGPNREQMAVIYNSADMYLQSSIAGALEIPIIEAKACGLPIISSEYAAPYELNLMGGVFGTLPIIGFKQESVRETGQFRAVIDCEKITDYILEYFKSDPSYLAKLSKDSIDTAQKYHNNDLTAEKWMSIFDAVSDSDYSRWTNPPEIIQTDFGQIPANIDDSAFVKYCCEKYLPPKHQLRSLYPEKEILKDMYLKGEKSDQGEVRQLGRSHIVNVIQSIVDRYNHFEQHRYNKLVLEPKQELLGATDNYFRVI
jgi:glycosyltransferase involved in cell wall biosynthesis